MLQASFEALVGFLFIMIRIMMFCFGAYPIIFDKGNGFFRGMHEFPFTRALQILSVTGDLPLSRVYAIQIIRLYIRTADDSPYRYELNPILEDASRVNVINYCDQSQTIEGAKHLAQFLQKP